VSGKASAKGMKIPCKELFIVFPLLLASSYKMQWDFVECVGDIAVCFPEPHYFIVLADKYLLQRLKSSKPH